MNFTHNPTSVMRSALTLGFTLLFAGVLPVFGSEEGATSATSAEVQKLEARVALIEKKLSLLAATSEEELTGASAVLADASLLYSQAKYMLEKERAPEGAYRLLAALHSLHPGSAEDRQAFALAAELFRGMYFRKRHVDPQGVWTTVEPVFMFQWLATFFSEEEGAPFPLAEAEKLLVGVPVSVLREFESFSARHPALRRWKLEFEKDNGIVSSLRPVSTEG